MSIWSKRTMPEGSKSENLLNSLLESFGDTVPKQKSVSFFEEEKSNSAASQFNRLFGRQKPVYHLLGGGKCRISYLLAFFSLTIYLAPGEVLLFLRICSCRCAVMEEQEDLRKCFIQCNSCLGTLSMAKLPFFDPSLLCSSSRYGCAVSLVKCFRIS